jgi:hypothetical protein
VAASPPSDVVLPTTSGGGAKSTGKQMMQTIMDMQQAIAGYAAQNPADDVFWKLAFIIACGVIW